ncbi:MAG: hypothetical protein OXD54_05140 [Candidatus Poribacteria bacterium]|nr:hypothetical protein [Candidatus Poribacteria bacterium]
MAATIQLSFDFNRPHSYTVSVPIEVDEFWTAKQRAGHSIHEISYRACYKPQLPAYFINLSCQNPVALALGCRHHNIT